MTSCQAIASICEKWGCVEQSPVNVPFEDGSLN